MRPSSLTPQLLFLLVLFKIFTFARPCFGFSYQLDRSQRTGLLVALLRQTQVASKSRPRSLKMSSDTTITSPAVDTATFRTTPPVARREEDRMVFAGVAPPGWNIEIPRQSLTSSEELLDPPVAVPDPYGWLRSDDRTDPEVLEHLQQENAYTEYVTRNLGPLRQHLYDEMLASILETDHTLPRPWGPHYYYSRTEQGKSYKIHCRAPKIQGEPLGNHIKNWDGQATTPILPGEQVLLDENILAVDKPYCSTGNVEVSPSQTILAYSVDFSGDEIYHMVIQNLETDEVILDDTSLEIDGSLEWAKDDSTIYYVTMDDAHRSYRVYRKRLDDPTKEDELLFEEPDETFNVGISKSLDEKYIFVQSSSSVTSEIHFMDLNDPDAALQCIAPRRTNVLYDVEHRHGVWWIVTNVNNSPNMKLLTAPATSNCQDVWTEVVDATTQKPLFDGSYERALEDITTFQNCVVAEGREDGIPRIWILSKIENSPDGSVTPTTVNSELLGFAETAYDVGLSGHYEFETDDVVLWYESLVTPPQQIEINTKDTTQRSVLKVKAVPGYSKDEYSYDRLTVTSRDGKTEIPVSIVYRKDVMEEHLATGTAVPVHLYGYGSYGICMESDFDATRLPLLNRKMVYVIAHVRGGAEMGRHWYEEPLGAKFLTKKRTFDDFVDVARWLVETKRLTNPGLMSCEGRSAGGLLIGASINQAPELFKVAIMGVPFVDVVCTMSDASIPLTVGEFEEWGCPNEKKFFQYMLEYSPIDNIQHSTYPACLLTCGLHDFRVQYWEPAKFVQVLRHTCNPESGPCCLKIELNAGHFSASDRYKYLKEKAFDYAFLLNQLGLDSSSST